MSHISKGNIKVKLKSKKLLIDALSKIGEVLENEEIYSYQGGGSYSKTLQNYEIVLVDNNNSKNRIGFNYDKKLNEYQMFTDEFGELGNWVRQVKPKLTDWYAALHYKAELELQNFEVTVIEENNELLIEANNYEAF